MRRLDDAPPCFPRGGKFQFEFSVPETYPYDAPKVLCKTKVRNWGAGSKA